MSEQQHLQPQEARAGFIGALLMHPELVLDYEARVAPHELGGQFREVYIEMLRAVHAGERFDANTLASVQGAPSATVIHDTMSRATSVNLPYYVDRIKDANLLRTTAERAYNLGDAIREGDITDAAEAAAQVERLHSMVGDAAVTEDYGNADTLADIMSWTEETHPQPRRLIPGLIRAEGRMMLVAGEGSGKSVLMRQLGICAAAGVRPFHLSGAKYRPCRVLHIDAENDPVLMARETDDDGRLRQTTVQAITRRVLAHADDPDGTLRRYKLLHRKSGFNFRDAGAFRWLNRHCEEHEPDIVIVSPLYKTTEAEPSDNDRREAEVLQRIFEALRDRHGCALLFENHAAKGSGGASRELTPFGSSFWLRWPDFGLTMRPDPQTQAMKIGSFRGDRYTTAWPPYVHRDKTGTQLPWVGYWPNGGAPS